MKEVATYGGGVGTGELDANYGNQGCKPPLPTQTTVNFHFMSFIKGRDDTCTSSMAVKRARGPGQANGDNIVEEPKVVEKFNSCGKRR